MYVCLCKSITDSQIRQAVDNGASSFGQIRKELGLASQCGKCGLLARQVFNESLALNADQAPLFYAAG